MRLIASLLILTVPTANVTVIDLTEVVAKQASWKVVEVRSGGPIGTYPQSEAYKPVTIRLLQPALRGTQLYFALEIHNERRMGLDVPVNLSSSLLDRKGQTIRFKQLLINVTPSNGDSLAISPLLMFGSDARPDTIRTLAPGETIVIRLKTDQRVGTTTIDLSKLQVQISGWDVELTPTAGGYKQNNSSIPALSAKWQPM